MIRAMHSSIDWGVSPEVFLLLSVHFSFSWLSLGCSMKWPSLCRTHSRIFPTSFFSLRYCTAEALSAEWQQSRGGGTGGGGKFEWCQVEISDRRIPLSSGVHLSQIFITPWSFSEPYGRHRQELACFSSYAVNSSFEYPHLTTVIHSYSF